MLASSTLVLAVAYIAFISIGFPDAVLGVAWPSIRTTFNLLQGGIGLILFSSGAGYCFSGLIAGKVIERLGVGSLLVLSTAFVTTGLLGYAIAPIFPVFLAFAVLIGLGSGAIDSALNFYAAERFSEAVMNRLHAFFGIGALIGPLIMGGVLDRDASWRWGYVAVGLVLFGMTVIFAFTRSLWTVGSGHAHHENGASVAATPVRDVLGQPLVWLNVAIFFFCTGVEFTGGQWVYTILHERLDQTAAFASLWAGLYWGALAAGRLTLGMVSARVGAARLVQVSIVGNMIGGVLYTSSSLYLTVLGLMLMGFWMAPLFPLLMTLTPRRLGSATSVHAVGFQVSAAVLGGAVLPWIAGTWSQHSGLGVIGWVAVAGGACLLVLHGVMMRATPNDVRGERGMTGQPELAE
ncbi:MAG: MFS transporter [Thermomicrobiales bacterium]